MKKIDVIVYGSEKACAGCVNAPSSKETYSWLQESLFQKFGNQVIVQYKNIEEAEAEQQTDDYMLPIVVIEGNIVAEGTVKLKEIIAYIIKYLDNH